MLRVIQIFDNFKMRKLCSQSWENSQKQLVAKVGLQVSIQAS